MAKSIRDLVENLPSYLNASEDLRSLASSEVTERTLIPPEAAEWVAMIPGDDIDQHPLAHIGRNPFPGVGVQEVFRQIQNGTLDPEVEKKARAYVSQYNALAKFHNEAGVYDSQNHVFVEPELTGMSGLNPAWDDPRPKALVAPPKPVPMPKIDAANEGDFLESLWKK